MISIKRSNLSKEDFQAVRDNTQWGNVLRKFEIEKALDGFPKDHFDKGLELGCGSGMYSKHIASYCKKLIALEYDESKLLACNDEKMTFMIEDATRLGQFSDGEMDLVFSSQLLAHLPRIDQCLDECRRVVKTEGLIIHIVPNRIWKTSNLLLHYPSVIKTVFRRIFSANKSDRFSGSSVPKPKLDDNLRPFNENRSLGRRMLPRILGISESHFREFVDFGEKRWISTFERNGLEIVGIVRLPFYFGHGYNFRIILRLGNFLGLSSSTAFVLRKTKKQ